MKVVVSHPTGNYNVRAVITGLANANLLAEFNTTIAIDHQAWLFRFLPTALRKEIMRRAFSLSLGKVKMHPNRELARIACTKIGLCRLIRQETGWASIDAVYQSFDSGVAKRLIRLSQRQYLSAVYAYEDGALHTFRKAKELGLAAIYDLPIAYWESGRRLLLEEALRLPRWAPTLGGGVNDSKVKLERKTQELEMADMVVCPSQFVKDSLPEWSKEKKVITVTFGTPEVHQFSLREIEKSRNAVNNPLRVLFCGSMGQRKGLGDLFEAIKLINSSAIELVVMGTLLAPMAFYKNEMPHFVYERGRPHADVLKLMRSCDVLCLPSIVEGRALVMQEAMSQGLPLIITPNTGGIDLIIEGKTGFLVPIRSPLAIAESLNWLLEHRAFIPEMGKMAQEHAASYTWGNYAGKIVELVNGLCNDDSYSKENHLYKQV